MFVHHITVSLFLYLCILYHLIFGYTPSWYFVLYLYCVYVSPPLRHFYICVCINMFVNVISLVTAIYLCTSHNRLLGCATYWGLCHAYFLYIIGYSIVVILVDLNSQKWIDILLFELVVKCIERHIFFPSLSIYHICISIIQFFCCFLLLCQLFTLSLQHYTTHIKHHLYNTFEQT